MSAFEEQELKQIENALARLMPRVDHFDRDRLLFEAGRRSVRPRTVWRWTTLAASAAAIMLTVTLFMRPDPERIVQFVNAPATTPSADAVKVEAPTHDVAISVHDEEILLSPTSYWRMQQAALRGGVEQMPTAPADLADGPAPRREAVPMAGRRDMLSTLLLTGDN